MTQLGYLLPLLIIFPYIINGLMTRIERARLSLLIFSGPLVFLALTIWSYLTRQPIQLFLGDVSTYFSIGLKLDVLSGLIASTVLTIGVIVIRFSIRYLEDDPQKKRFSKNLSYTLSFVLLMLMAPNLALMFFSWVGASYFLHLLLTHYSHRDGAQRAAQQKFWVSRLGDFFIICAAALLLLVFKSLDFETIFKIANDPIFLKQNNLLINLTSIFLVLGAMTKSAQFPFHFWLPKTMETPTPVSALMHAGIINAGGYLVVRMSPLLSHAPLSLTILALIGGFTAFFGTIIMFTQTDVKKNLAYSTISQMGFMMLQCGLGAFPIAVVHIIGHAFYKAYAFLSSATATDYGRLNRYRPIPELKTSISTAIFTALISLTFIMGGFIYMGNSILDRPGVSVLLVVLSLAVAQIILSSVDKFKSTLSAVGVITIYLSLSVLMTHLLKDTIPHHVPINGTLRNMTFILCTGFFVTLYLIQNGLEKISKTEVGKRIYVKALRGALS